MLAVVCICVLVLLAEAPYQFRDEPFLFTLTRFRCVNMTEDTVVDETAAMQMNRPMLDCTGNLRLFPASIVKDYLCCAYASMVDATRESELHHLPLLSNKLLTVCQSAWHERHSTLKALDYHVFSYSSTSTVRGCICVRSRQARSISRASAAALAKSMKNCNKKVDHLSSAPSQTNCYN